ncbi:MAG: hypothetical protein IJW53_04890 [Clostridia bacterium]|nr:hypothetical protein [Clostridia bacterium]
MKKITVVSAASFLFLLICSVVARLSKGLFIGNKATLPLIIGIVILAISGIIALIVRERTKVNLFCFALSAVAMGFIMRAWYILRDLDNSIFITLLISLGAVVYLWIYFALIHIPVVKESAGVTVAVSVLYVLISIVIYVILVLKTETSFVSTAGFYAFIEISFIFAMSMEVNDNEELIRNLTLSTYSVFVVAAIVAVFALMAASGSGDCDCDCGGCDCDGSCCDGCDCGGSDSAKATKKKKRRV